ncbi:hypothetical protein C4544_02440 [candidate division WS5 bacterium]|uniref:PRC-barrel domain-containing protein n=1 Tax=candidate division WS5 bacterium TaxID=2093353 RepID=A0A419DEP0_9BACT|nr:MAG: hypothetical protein C4544_02440 [candidate division WS5 bacterium]
MSMQKLSSEFNNTAVISRQEHAILGTLSDVIIHPKDKKAVGMVLETGREDIKAVFNASDVVGIGTNFIMIKSADNLSPPDEIIRLKEILDLGIELNGSKVVDEDGRHLGKIRDWSVDLKTMYLSRLYVVSASWIKALSQDLIISGDNVIRIEKGRVIVRGGSVKSEKSANVVRKRASARVKPAHLAKAKRS